MKMIWSICIAHFCGPRLFCHVPEKGLGLKKEGKRVQVRRARSLTKKPPSTNSPASRQGDFPERKMHALTPGRRLRIVARTEITTLSWHGRVENLAALQLINHTLVLSGFVLSKTAIFPKKKGRKREISNEFARGSSLYEANIEVSAKGAPHDGQDTIKTLQTIIWYKRACIRQTTRQPSVAVQPLTKGRQEKC